MDSIRDLYASEESSDEKKTLVIAPTTTENFLVSKKVLPDKTKEISENYRVDELFAPAVGPANPFKTENELTNRNTYTGVVEHTFVNANLFEAERKSHSANSATQYKANHTGDYKKRKRERNDDPADVLNFKGPWADYKDMKKVAKPTDDQLNILDEMRLNKIKLKSMRKIKNTNEEFSGKRHDWGEPVVEPPRVEDRVAFHVDSLFDYQGRSFIEVNAEQNTSLKSDRPPNECFLPKKLIHTYKAHDTGVSVIRLFPNSGHLLLSGGMDAKVKLFELYNERRHIYTISAHKKGIKDICFNNDGTKFLTCSYDKWIKLFDTESGKCEQFFTTNKVANCVRFHPDKQNLFIAGMVDYKMVTWDIDQGSITQQYDRHLGPVNTITFFDDNRRMITSSDDKSFRIWEWDIPVDTKQLADPGMQAVGSVAVSPSGQYLLGQLMSDRMIAYDFFNRVKAIKKEFRGHTTGGYICQPGFSPDSKYVISGDCHGMLYIWAWSSCKLMSKFACHDKVVNSCIWLPHEVNKLVTCSWDGTVKLWG